jgi:hypothetical protein
MNGVSEYSGQPSRKKREESDMMQTVPRLFGRIVRVEPPLPPGDALLDQVRIVADGEIRGFCGRCRRWRVVPAGPTPPVCGPCTEKRRDRNE